MEIILGILIAAILIGLPTWLILKIMKKAEQDTTIYSPEEITKKLQDGFFLSNWGLELSFGGVLLFALMFCDIHDTLKFILPIGSVTLGLVLFFIGRIKIGITSRYLNFCNRERTKAEEVFLENIIDIENVAMHANGINTIARLTPNKLDDIASLKNNKGIIQGFTNLGKTYTRKNVLKKHWPIISMILILVLSIIITIAR